MTRDGRPSRIKDFRLFGLDEKSQGMREATAFGRRLAWWLNGEGFSIGHESALYVTLDASAPEGALEAKPQRFTPDDWWFREVSIGVPADFSGDETKLASESIVACLRMLKPHDTELIDTAARTVGAAAERCRFLLKVKETAKEVMEVSTTIGTWPGPSLLYVGVTDKTTGAYRQAPPVEVKFYDDGVLLVGQIKAARGRVVLVPRASTSARMVAEKHGGGISWSVDDFTEAERPDVSGLLAFR